MAFFDLGMESHSRADDVFIAALSGGMAFAISGGLPAIVIGAIAGLPAASIISRLRTAHHSLKRRRSFLTFLALFADSLLLLALAIVATAIAWMMGFGFLFAYFYGGE